LRQLTHQVLAAQEDERKKISRELQDEIAQTLLGINVRLLTLKQEARSNTKGLKNEIASTQRLVLKSAKSVRRAAREFRQFMKAQIFQTLSGGVAGLSQARPAGEPATGARHGPAGAGRRPEDAGLAKLHEQILVTRVLPGVPAGKRAALIKQAGIFFTEAITPIEKIHRSAREAARPPEKIVEMLSQRTVELAASNLELEQEIVQRKAAEAALKKSEHHYSRVAGTVGPPAGTVAAVVPPDSFGPGGGAPGDQPRTA
jgi:hypothetical protein